MIHTNSNFNIFADPITKGFIVKGIKVKNTADKPRSFFDKLNDWAKEEGAAGLGYINFYENEFKFIAFDLAGYYAQSGAIKFLGKKVDFL